MTPISPETKGKTMNRLSEDIALVRLACKGVAINGVDASPAFDRITDALKPSLAIDGDLVAVALERIIQRAKTHVSSGDSPNYEVYKLNEQDCIDVRCGFARAYQSNEALAVRREKE